VYTSTKTLVDTSFNCSFGLINTNAEEPKAESIKECLLGDEGHHWSVKALQDIMENVKQGEEHK
jgi:hypothetical protein